MKLIALPSFLIFMLVSYPVLSKNNIDPVNKTHLGVVPKNLVSLESFCISNDNSLSNKFYYDRDPRFPFEIPVGYSFVVTDINVFPNCDASGQNAAFNTLVLVEGPEATRNFTIRSSGTDTKHFALTGGITYPSGSVPHPRNAPDSSGKVQIQLLGYFIFGDALDPGEPFLPLGRKH